MASNGNDRKVTYAKLALFCLALIPALLLGWDTYNDQLGPNPVEALQRRTGAWTFNFLLLALAISPVRQMAELSWLVRLRRMIGLFAFFYGTLHLLTFAGFDHAFEMAGIWQDVLDRRFVTAGFAAWVVMIPLAATSFDRVIRALGGARWQALQRSVYLVGILGAVHYFWLAKGTALLWPIGYALMLAVLFSWRIWKRLAS